MRNSSEKVSTKDSGFSATISSWRWWDSDMVWHLNPFCKARGVRCVREEWARAALTHASRQLQCKSRGGDGRRRCAGRGAVWLFVTWQRRNRERCSVTQRSTTGNDGIERRQRRRRRRRVVSLLPLLSVVRLWNTRRWLRVHGEEKERGARGPHVPRRGTACCTSGRTT